METAGVVVWSSQSEERRDGLEQAIEIARGTSQPHPITLNNYRCLVHPYGMGKGRQTHLKFRITWGDVTLGLDFRSKASRRFHNFSLTVPGGPCLIYGGLAVREWAFKLVNALGGGIHDEWIRRLDVCVDLPGLNPRQDLFPACCSNQFTSTAQHHRIDCHQGETETFTLSSNDRLTLQIYDKLREATSKNDPVYLQAMVDNRWNGALPEAATRVELQVYRNWLAQWEDDTADRILNNLGSVVERLLPETGKAFFRLLDRTPDMVTKENKATGVRAKYASAHDLRRGCAARLINSGVSAETVKVVMRHADFATTEKHYGAIRSAQAAGDELQKKLIVSDSESALAGG